MVSVSHLTPGVKLLPVWLAAAVLNMTAAELNFNIILDRTLLIAFISSCQTPETQCLPLHWLEYLGAVASCSYIGFLCAILM
jgi:hypothetical protein